MNQPNKRISRSGLLLTETLIAILFFAIASAICLQLFAKTHSLSRWSMALSLACEQTDSISDLLTIATKEQTDFDSVYNFLRTYYKNASAEGESIIIYYNNDYEPCKKNEAIFALVLSSSKQWGLDSQSDYGLMHFNLTLSDLAHKSKGEIIYEVPITVYHTTPAKEQETS